MNITSEQVESGELMAHGIVRTSGPAHAVYFGTYELVKEMAGGNVDEGHHPLAAGRSFVIWAYVMCYG